MATKRLSAKDLRAQSAVELKEQIDQLRQDLWQQRLKAREGGLQQTHQLSLGRRHIARITTILNEQQRKPTSSKGS